MQLVLQAPVQIAFCGELWVVPSCRRAVADDEWMFPPTHHRAILQRQPQPSLRYLDRVRPPLIVCQGCY